MQRHANGDVSEQDGSKEPSFLFAQSKQSMAEQCESTLEKQPFLYPNDQTRSTATAAPLEIIVASVSDKQVQQAEAAATNDSNNGRILRLSLLVIAAFVAATHLKKSKTLEKNSNQQQQELSPSVHLSSCTWAPGQNAECFDAIRWLVCQNHDQDTNSPKRIPRLALFGDSTMDRLFRWGGIHLNLVTLDKKHMLKETGLVTCKVKDKRDRCHLNEQFQFSYPANQTWIPPDFANPSIFEGPLGYGLDNPFCQDCRGCSPAKIDCIPMEQPTGSWDIVSTLTNLSEHKQLVYGGFMGIEYARDVELQTNQLRTTQENVASYLGRMWNAPKLLQVWQKPTCLVNTGHHDVSIPGITLDAYISNVQRYLHLLVDQCRHIVWLSTTAPETDHYEQKIEATKTWGIAVRHMLEEDRRLQNRTLYIDVYGASRTFPHHDNLHLEKEWYQSLGTLFEAETFLNC